MSKKRHHADDFTLKLLASDAKLSCLSYGLAVKQVWVGIMAFGVTFAGIEMFGVTLVGIIVCTAWLCFQTQNPVRNMSGMHQALKRKIGRAF